MTEIRRIRTEAEKAAALLSAASELMLHGRLVSISSLKKIIGSICSSFDSMSAEERKNLQPMMVELAEKLDRFGSEMAEQYHFLTQKKDG